MIRATAATLAAALLAATAAAASRPPARIQVTADEFTLTLSRTSVVRGPVVLELFNLGEDDHDLALRRIATRARTMRVPSVTPGQLGRIEARLEAGRYRLWCTIANHRSRGMAATLVVRPR